MKPSGVPWHHTRASRPSLPHRLEPWRVLSGAGIRQPLGAQPPTRSPSTRVGNLEVTSVNLTVQVRPLNWRPEEGTQGHSQKEAGGRPLPRSAQCRDVRSYRSIWVSRSSSIPMLPSRFFPNHLSDDSLGMFL